MQEKDDEPQGLHYISSDPTPRRRMCCLNSLSRSFKTSSYLEFIKYVVRDREDAEKGLNKKSLGEKAEAILIQVGLWVPQGGQNCRTRKNTRGKTADPPVSRAWMISCPGGEDNQRWRT